ncbi:MAG: hypothetical protein WCP93_02440 [Candidatus Berkelbacteria bacterium]
MSDIAKGVIDSLACQEIQKLLFFYLISKHIYKKQIFRFNYEHKVDPSLPPIDIYLTTKNSSGDIKECRQFIEVKAGNNINTFGEFCDAVYNFYMLFDYLIINKSDISNIRFDLYHSQSSNFIHQLKFIKSKHTSLKSASKYRTIVKNEFLFEIKEQIEKERKGSKIDCLRLEKVIKILVPVQIEEEMIVEDLKYIYWKELFSEEIESKFSYLYEVMAGFIIYRRKVKNYNIYFDNYLFTKDDCRRLLGERKPEEFVSTYGLDSDMITASKGNLYDRQ